VYRLLASVAQRLPSQPCPPDVIARFDVFLFMCARSPAPQEASGKLLPPDPDVHIQVRKILTPPLPPESLPAPDANHLLLTTGTPRKIIKSEFPFRK